MTTSADDLSLKHGDNIAGQWNILGILDATLEDPSEEEADLKPYTNVGMAISELQNMLRLQFGRPTGSYGITPVLIFRSIRS